MRPTLLLCLLMATLASPAQKGLEEMIAAEKSFAAYSVAHGARDAFVKFLDTNAIMFNNASSVNGYQLWRARPATNFTLNWWPTHAEVSIADDWGWTAGPWTYSDAGKDSISATGYFFTIWQKKAGEWKVVLDVGTEQNPINSDTTINRLMENKSRGTEQSLANADYHFNRTFALDSVEAYASFAQPKTILVRENFRFITNSTFSRVDIWMGSIAKFTQQGHGLAPSGDVGYTYGVVQSGIKKETYLRIWRHGAEGWKLALEMLRL